MLGEAVRCGRQSSSAGFSPASRRRTRRNSSAPPVGLVCKPLRRILFDPAFLRRCRRRRRRLDAGRRSSETPAPPELVDDLIREILLRVPPDEPAHLVRAALVCKPWRRILVDPAFLRRYREFHLAPPLLGMFCFEHPAFQFLSTTTAPPLPFPAAAHRRVITPADYRFSWAVDCRHGRVLFYSHRSPAPKLLILWDPVTGDEQSIPMPYDLSPEIFSAAVLCVADGCNHLYCHGRPFLLVLAGTDKHDASWVTEFSSETGRWSALTQVDFSPSNRLDPDTYIAMRPSLLVGDAIYFFLEQGKAILKYNLGGRGLSVIDAPDLYDGILMTVVDGELGFAGVEGYDLHLWSWKANNAEGSAAWVHLREINLQTLFSIPDSDIEFAPELVGFAEGTDTIFFRRNETIFTLKLKSGQVRNVGPSSGYRPILPYMSFYTPDLVGVRPPPP